MQGLNKVMLIGNATRNAELRHTANGKAVSNIRLATNRVVGGAKKTQYHTIICWGPLAEQTGKYVTKGRLEQRTFTDDEGKHRRVVEIIASEVQFLTGRPGERTSEPVADTAPPEDELNVEDIPL